MITHFLTRTHRRTLTAALSVLAAVVLLVAPPLVRAQCPATDVITDLRGPLGVTLSKKNNLLVAEIGTQATNSGRISIVGLTGTRRTLIDGLPSGFSSEGNQPSGPTGLFLRDRTLYAAIGVGDSVINGSAPQSTVPNPNPSSPLFSSVLALRFSAAVEKTTQGFALTAADQQKLADKQPVTLTNPAGEQLTIELVANFPDSTPDPRPDFPANVRNTNPFDLVAVGNRLYVSDGGQNLIWRVDLTNGNFATLATFPPVANPLPFGPPVVDAVPTGIVFSDGKLLVTLFRGFPFAAGTSTVEQVDLQTGSHSPFIGGRKTAIDILPIRADEDLTSTTRYLVLEHASGDMLSGPGRLLRFDRPDSTPVVIADCLAAPAAMTLDQASGILYVTELNGHIAAIPVRAEGHDAEAGVPPTLLNIATRGKVQPGDDALIAGFISGEGTGGGSSRIVVRAIGPSLTSSGVANPLQDPTIELHDGSGALLASNDNWKDSQQAELQATGIAPTDDRESAIVRTLVPGLYSAIVRGKGNASGIALAEVYAVQ